MKRTYRLARWRARWEALIEPRLDDIASTITSEEQALKLRVGDQLNVQCAIDFRLPIQTVECIKLPDGWKYRPSVFVATGRGNGGKLRPRVQRSMEWRPLAVATSPMLM